MKTRIAVLVFVAAGLGWGCATPAPQRPQPATPEAKPARPATGRLSPVKDAALPRSQGTEPTPWKLVPLRSGDEAPTRGIFVRRGKGPGAKETSADCADKASGVLWFCSQDRWLAGENRDKDLTHPGGGPDDALRGVDLGISVRFGAEGKTFFYMGDSFGRISRGNCGLERPQDYCNDAVLVGRLDKVTRPERGVPVQLVVSDSGDNAPGGFVPIVIDGINGRDPLPLCREGQSKPSFGPPCLGNFNTPTGALSARLDGSVLGRGKSVGKDVVLLWFATAQALFDEQAGRTLAASWLTVSEDGVSFRKLLDQPFSRDKFINVSPVLVTAEHRRIICEKDPSSPLCHSSLGAKADIALLFASGERYRKSPMYLGVLDLSTLETRYYSGDANKPWVEDEARAAPIVGTANPKPVEQFGELSVKLVPADACPLESRSQCEDTLVLLANQAGFVRYRTAALSRPANWSIQRKSSGIGYGPYIIEAFTKVVKSEEGGLELELYHVLSSWDGKPLKTKERNPYGVFTRRLLLVGADTCGDNELTTADCLTQAPVWPPKGQPRPTWNKPRPGSSRDR